VGAAQINRWLLRRYSTQQILGKSLLLVMAAGLLLAASALTGWGGFPALVVLLFFTLASGGLVGPNATAIALAPCGRLAGSASALLGTLQFGLGGLIGAVVGHFSEQSAYPLCATLALCSIAGYAAFQWAAKEGKIASDEEEDFSVAEEEEATGANGG
jgi:DHA1 family bicyclomycin/chloramphenicol resistance-like MFS transporter